MNRYKKYGKIRTRLEFAASMIAFIVGDRIAYYFGLTGKKLITVDTGIYFAIIIGLAFVLNIFAISIADKWYEKNTQEEHK